MLANYIMWIHAPYSAYQARRTLVEISKSGDTELRATDLGTLGTQQKGVQGGETGCLRFQASITPCRFVTQCPSSPFPPNGPKECWRVPLYIAFFLRLYKCFIHHEHTSSNGGTANGHPPGYRANFHPTVIFLSLMLG